MIRVILFLLFLSLNTRAEDVNSVSDDLLSDPDFSVPDLAPPTLDDIEMEELDIKEEVGEVTEEENISSEEEEPLEEEVIEEEVLEKTPINIAPNIKKDMEEQLLEEEMVKELGEEMEGEVSDIEEESKQNIEEVEIEQEEEVQEVTEIEEGEEAIQEEEEVIGDEEDVLESEEKVMDEKKDNVSQELRVREPILEIPKNEEKKEEKIELSRQEIRSILDNSSLLYDQDTLNIIRSIMDAIEAGEVVSRRSKSKVEDEDKTQKRTSRSAISFFLDSIIFLSQDHWIVWVNGNKITNEKNNSELKVISISSEEVSFEWQTGYGKFVDVLEQFNSEGNLPQMTKVEIADEIAKVIFTLKPNQSFEISNVVKIKEGR